MINLSELVEILEIGESDNGSKLNKRMAQYLEENERAVQYRRGYQARAHGELVGLTGDERPSFKEGYCDRIREEREDPSLGFDLDDFFDTD